MKATLLKNPLIRYFVEAREELRKVTWPSQKEVMYYSLIVVALCVVIAAYFGLLDWALTLGLEELVKVTR